jgi:hypothetical protein
MTELEEAIAPKYKSIDELPYRKGTIGLITESENNFLVVQMVGYGENEKNLKIIFILNIN